MNTIEFWTAFGAIGTTVGSLITALAVSIAVKQYRQPITKKVEVKHGLAMPVGFGTNNSLFYIQVSNRGVRDVVVTGFYLHNKKRKYFLNSVQDRACGALEFPLAIKPEESYTFYIDYNIFRNEIINLYKDDSAILNRVMRSAIQDSTGDYHFSKAKVHIKSILKN